MVTPGAGLSPEESQALHCPGVLVRLLQSLHTDTTAITSEQETSFPPD